jgi:cell division protein FtsN
MYVDFKEERARQSGFGSGLLWMLSGIMMGLLVGLAMYYFANRGIPSAEAASTSQGTSSNTTSSFAKDKKVTSPFGDAKDLDDPEALMTASLVDKNHKEEIKERPSFSYYAVLPDLNVPIQTIHNPIEEKKPKEKIIAKPQVEKTTMAAGKSGYFLQIASYRQRHQADRAKGRLKRKGMTTYVEKRKVRGKTWFRLMAGPVKAKTLNSWKATVVSLGHKPLVYPAK